MEKIALIINPKAGGYSKKVYEEIRGRNLTIDGELYGFK